MTDTTAMQGKLVIVTGASNGIGLETTRGLVQQGAHVVMVVRNRGKTEIVRDDLLKQTPHAEIDIMTADFSSQDSIRQFAQDFLKTYDRLDVLVNNAGGIFAKRSTTVDGIEYTFAVNHLGYFLVTNLLLDRLKSSAPARIVSVSSMAHAGAKIRFDDMQYAKSYNSMGAYGQSKLANIMFTYALARRLEGTHVTANCLHPGVVSSGFAKNNGGIWSLGISLLSPIFISPTKGAQTSIFLASSPLAEGVSGKYFDKSKPVATSRISYNIAEQERLWHISADLTHLNTEALK